MQTSTHTNKPHCYHYTCWTSILVHSHMRKLCRHSLYIEELSSDVELIYALTKFQKEDSNLHKHPNRAIVCVEVPSFLQENIVFPVKGALIYGNLLNGCGIFTITGAWSAMFVGALSGWLTSPTNANLSMADVPGQCLQWEAQLS